MVGNRAGEIGTVPGRSSRFHNRKAVWYFQTREGAEIGPFSDQSEASKGLDDFLDFLALADPKTLSSFYRSLNEVAASQMAS